MGAEVYFDDIIRLAPADIEASAKGHCNVPPHVVNDRLRILITGTKKDISRICTNFIWYATHHNYGCTYFSCGYVFYNFHWTPTNWITPTSPVTNFPNWLPCINMQEAAQRGTTDMFYGVLCYLQKIGKQLGHRTQILTDEEFKAFDIPEVRKVRFWLDNILYFQEFYKKLGVYDQLSNFRYPMVRPRIVESTLLNSITLQDYLNINEIANRSAAKWHYDRFMFFRNECRKLPGTEDSEFMESLGLSSFISRMFHEENVSEDAPLYHTMQEQVDYYSDFMNGSSSVEKLFTKLYQDIQTSTTTNSAGKPQITLRFQRRIKHEGKCDCIDTDQIENAAKARIVPQTENQDDESETESNYSENIMLMEDEEVEEITNQINQEDDPLSPEFNRETFVEDLEMALQNTRAERDALKKLRGLLLMTLCINSNKIHSNTETSNVCQRTIKHRKMQSKAHQQRSLQSRHST